MKMVEKENNKGDCIFCKIVKKEVKAEIIFEDDNFIVINDAHPQTPGHCLIIPRKHYTTLLDMPETLGTEVITLAKKNGLRLIKEKKADGFNFAQNNFPAAGQVVMHVHFHIIPRNNSK